jgi:hypothetical protein
LAGDQTILTSMAANWRILFTSSITITLIAMLLAGCLSVPQVNPPENAEPATPAPSSSQTPIFPLPATPVSVLQSPTSPAPTLTRTPTLIPSGSITLPYDLLFLSGGRLMRWSHIQNINRTAVIDVIDYSASQDGSRIAILRKTGIAANAVETFDLTILDTGNGNFVTLLDAAPRLPAFQISPDGQWVALMNELQQLYLLPSDGSNAGVKISDCQSNQVGDCNDLAWSADSQMVIWDDAQGVWQAGPASLLPVQAIANPLDIADPEGQLIRKQVQYHGLDWSPFGRYVLTRIQPIGSNVSWQAIIDTRLKRLAEIPMSYQLDESTALALWLKNGNLLVIHRGAEQESQAVALESWQILPTRDDLMELDFRWEIPSESLISLGSNIHWEELPTSPCQLNERTLSFVWNSVEVDGPSGLFTFDIKYGSLSKIADLPAHAVNTIWTPDGDAALVMESDGTLIFVPVDGNNISDVTARFGRQTCCYTWLVDGNTLP